MKEVDVVVGIILKRDKFLVERRMPHEKLDPGIVCLPGGHVRRGESKEEACARASVKTYTLLAMTKGRIHIVI